MVCGIVNGGLGLSLAGNSNKGMIVYAVVAGVVGALYVLLVMVKRKGVKGFVGGAGRKSEGGSDEVRDVRYG